MGVAGEGVADPDRVVFRLVEGAVGLVGERKGWEGFAVAQDERLGESYGLCFNDEVGHDAVLCFKL
jgi:hypothetical protein